MIEAERVREVLVVDDHAVNLKLLRMVLELDGYRVVSADSLAAARRAVHEHVPDLVVLDLQLPDGDGLELAQLLKRDPLTSGCAILACTAGAMREDRERAIGAGCDAYTSKPIDVEAFSRLVESLLERAPETTVR